MHLFKKDIFSVRTPVFSELSHADKEGFSTLLKKHYPGFFIKEIYKIGAFEINSNNWKVQSQDATYILKRAPLNKWKSLSSQAQWTAQLEATSFPTLKFLKNKDGQFISKEEDFVYCITCFEEGEYFGSSSKEWPELVRNTKKLYDFCLADRSFTTLNLPSRTYFAAEEDQLLKKLQAHTDIKEVSSSQLAMVIQEYIELRSFYEDSRKLLNTVVFHVDIHPHNLIFKENKLILFTDFESFQITTLEISLGFGLFKCLRQVVALEHDLSEEKITEKLSLLKAQFHAGFPDHSLEELLVFGKADVLKRILYILNELTETGQSKWLFILQTQLLAIEEINEISRIVRSIDNRNL